MEQPNVEELNVQQPSDLQNPPSETAENEGNPTLDTIIEEYASLSREQLVEKMKQIISQGEYSEMRIHVPLLKNAFQNADKLFREQQQAQAQTENTAQNTDVQVGDSEVKEDTAEENTQGKAENEAEKTEEKQQDAVRQVFYELYNEFKVKKQQFLQQQEEEKQQNFVKKQSLLEELKTLLDSQKTLKEIYDEFNAIQDKWKQVGSVPHTEVNNLWESYHFLMDKFYEKVNMIKQMRDMDLNKNLETKLSLCEKAEQLLLTDDINNSFSILQQYHKQWKETGPVPVDKNNEVWERFKKASDDINERRRLFYEKRSGEFEQNLKIKQELVALAKQLNSVVREKISQWNEDTKKMDELFETWKQTGPVPSAYNESIWQEFKSQKDGFFEARKQMFQNVKQREEENYNAKVSLCEAAEQIAKRTDFDAATRDLLDLQAQWKETGFVKKSVSDALYKRFRAACDEFFEAKSENYKRTHQQAEENIKAKENLITELSEYNFTDDKAENLKVITDFRKRWFEVGFTPKKERDDLQKRWDEILEKNKQKLQLTAEEISDRFSQFSSTVRGIASGGKEAINKRIAALERQIDSYENNLGFFSLSKNADVLKKEIESKINKLKREKESLTVRLKELVTEKVEEKTDVHSEEKEEKND